MSIEINKKFYDACLAGDINDAKNLLSKGADVNFIENTNNSCLIMSRDIHIITLLLSNGANVNYKNAQNESAILISSFNGYVEIVNLLLSNGANINDTDRYGDTPLLLSIHNGQLKMAKFLLGNKGINVSIKNKKGDTALSLATEEDYDELVQLIKSSRV